MAYAHEDEHHDRVAIAPYYDANIYIDGHPATTTRPEPTLTLNYSDDDGVQWRTPRLEAQTVKRLRLALARAERWMEKAADR